MAYEMIDSVPFGPSNEYAMHYTVPLSSCVT